MNDLISRSELISYLKEEIPNANFYLFQGYLKAVERIEKMPSAGGWISCKEGMPEAYKELIFFAHDKFVCCGKYCGIRSGHKTWESGVGIYWDDEVTHWQLLPEPPEV